MTINITDVSSGKVALNGVLDRNTVPSLWPIQTKRLEQAADGDKKLQIDLAGVNHVDTSGLAWLLKLLQETQKQHLDLVFTNAPDNLLKLAKISDVETLLPIQ